jgi:DNA topoisomerase-1
VGADGRPVRDPKHLERIRSLAILPAWINVWICPSANGHLQAVGRDAKGRKQYRYHPLYRSVRDEAKFSRMIAFGTVLSVIRRGVKRGLQRRGLPKEKIIATVVRLLETAFVRIGNDEYASENDSFGLTTLQNRHVAIAGTRLMFRFRGKSGQEHTIELTDRRLAKIVRLLAVCELYASGRAANQTPARRGIVDAVKRVAKRLGNRPATCRKYYVHPAVIDAYADGSLFPLMKEGEQQHAAYAGLGLRPEEYSTMVIVADYQERQARAKVA